MTAIVIGLAVVILVVVIVSRARKARADSEVMRGLRLRVLEAPPEEIGLSDAGDEPFAVLMDIGLDRATATLFAASTGDASIYLSSGGGVIGGYAHENVRAAAKALVTEAAQHLSRMQRVSEFPCPAAGNVRFYVRTREAIYAAEAADSALGEKADALWPLFYAGQEVLTQLRLTGASE
jgi:hypothetical protein